jgi:hypothetical protein
MSSQESSVHSGWAIFVGVVLLIAGVFALIMGIAAINNQYLFTISSQGLIVWTLTGFGWYHVIVGSLMILTSLGLFAMQSWARIIAVILVAINAISQVFWLTTTPFWSIVMIALDVAVIYGLTARWTQLEEQAGLR